MDIFDEKYNSFPSSDVIYYKNLSYDCVLICNVELVGGTEKNSIGEKKWEAIFIYINSRRHSQTPAHLNQFYNFFGVQLEISNSQSVTECIGYFCFVSHRMNFSASNSIEISAHHFNRMKRNVQERKMACHY